MMDLFTGNLAIREQSRALFQYILAEEPVTRPMILNHLKFPPTTLNRALDRLLEMGLIAENGQAESTGGRPASLFTVISDARLIMGLSIGERMGQLIVIDLLSKTVAQREAALSASPDTASRAEVLVTAAVELLSTIPNAGKRLIGIGVTANSVLSSVEAPALLAMLHNRLMCPVSWVDGLSGAATLLHDHQAGARRVALLSIGEQLTLELSDTCESNSSSRSTAAIAGFLAPDPLEEEPTDLVPVKDLVTIPAIGRRFAAMRDNPELGFPDFQTALHQGKKKALRILDATAESLALMMVNITCISGDMDFILTGDLPEILPNITDLTAEKANGMSSLSSVSLRLIRQGYGSFLPAAGAASLILTRALNRSAHVRGLDQD